MSTKRQSVKKTKKENTSNVEEKANTTTAKKVAPKKTDDKKIVIQSTPRDCVIAKYKEAGWIITPAPKGVINDMIAHKPSDIKKKIENGDVSLNEKYHFIQVYEDGNARHEMLPKNQFIQNAMSNGAIPIYAKIVDGKVTLSDVNLNARILIRKATN
jgi:hypothetical protein